MQTPYSQLVTLCHQHNKSNWSHRHIVLPYSIFNLEEATRKKSWLAQFVLRDQAEQNLDVVELKQKIGISNRRGMHEKQDQYF